MNTIVVRKATAHDLPAIAAIYGHHVRHGLASFETEAPTLAEITRRFGTITGGGYPYLVAEVGQVVAGFAYASVYRARPAYRSTVEDSIYIAPEAVGRGIGRALLEHLIAVCEQRGYRQMLGVIGDSANQASIRLHLACGFRQRAVLDAVGYKFGRWVDSVIMQRGLGEADRCPPADIGVRP